MEANNTEGLTPFEINLLVQQGGKFVQFPYMSGLIQKIKPSNIYFVRPEENTFKYALKHFFSNLNLNLQTLPNSPIYILKSLYFLAKGGKDYTFTMLEKVNTTALTQNSNLYDLYDLNSLQEL